MNTILVVEDEIYTADLLRRYFELAGYEVVSAHTGSEAIRLAFDCAPQVIILDIILPDMDGYAVCRKLRGDARTKDIPIIFLTRKDSSSSRLDGLEMGADDYLTKPFDVEELRLRVQKILDRVVRKSTTPLVDPKTSLPNIDLIVERLPELLDDPEVIYVNVEIRHYADFRTKYGKDAAAQVQRSTAKLLGDVLHEIDPERTFLGHPRDEHFLLGLPYPAFARLRAELPRRFATLAERFYGDSDRRRGSMRMGFEDVPFMSLNIIRVKVDALRVLVAKYQRERAPKGPLRLPARLRSLS